MEQTYTPLSVRDIDNNIEGKPLSESEIRLFEESYQKYIDDSKENKEQMEETINEIANLLTVNQNNLESVQNQNWFTRSWNTVSGKNGKLEKINQSNLLKIQKGSLFFLQNLAERNQATMESVIYAIKRVEDIQIESIKLKGYLSQIVLKYNNRIKKIENKLIEHDIEINKLNKNDSRMLYIFFSVLLLLGSIVLFVLTDSLFTKWIFSGILLIFSLSSFITIFRNKNKIVNTSDNKIDNKGRISEIREDNLKLRANVNNAIYKVFQAKVKDELLHYPLSEYFKSLSQIENEWKTLSEGEIGLEEGLSITQRIIGYEIINMDRVFKLINKNVSDYINNHSIITESIVKNYFPDTIGIDLLSNLDIQTQRQIVNQLENSLNPYISDLKDIINFRLSLINNFDKFSKLMKESWGGWKYAGKVLVEAFTFGFVGDIRGDQEFCYEYINNDIKTYIEKLKNLAKVFDSSILPLQSRIYDELINVSVHKIQPLLDEFDKNNISIKPFLFEIEEWEKKNE